MQELKMISYLFLPLQLFNTYVLVPLLILLLIYIQDMFCFYYGKSALSSNTFIECLLCATMF